MSGDTEIKTISKMRRVYKDTKANLDALTGLREEDLGYGTDTGTLYRWSGTAWETVTAPSLVSDGQYTGDGTANRAIPHGLGATPKIVFINLPGYYRCIYDLVDSVRYVSNNALGAHAVTAMDSTNFYVGNAAEYNQSGNQNASTYTWVAIG